MKQTWFITGTDTNVGKTWVTVALLHYFRQQGLNVAGFKPVAAGCTWQNGQWQNDDALLLQQFSSVSLTYQQVNPYAFKLACSPHIAAQGCEVSLPEIAKTLEQLQSLADVVLVEGAGGWLSPLSARLDNAGLASALQLPVVLVVAIRLGCINHARLSFAAIQQAKQSCIGWVAVAIEPDRADFQANIDFIQAQVNVPLLGVMPYLAAADFQQLAKGFNF